MEDIAGQGVTLALLTYIVGLLPLLGVGRGGSGVSYVCVTCQVSTLSSEVKLNFTDQSVSIVSFSSRC